MPYLKLNDAEFFYEIEGNGPDLVIISGYATETSYWKDVVQLLKNNYRVILFDNRGSGLTKDHNQSLSIEIMADDVASIIDALKLQKPHILGYSLGSCIAQSLAAKCGNQINKLILVSSTPKFRLSALNYLKTSLELRKQGANLDLLIELYLSLTYGEETLQNPNKIKQLKTEILENKNLSTVENSFRQWVAMNEFNGLNLLKSIDNETLIIHGREDILCLTMESQYMAAHLKDASFVELNCGHGIPKEAPESLVQITHNFLNSVHAH